MADGGRKARAPGLVEGGGSLRVLPAPMRQG